jgi:hypothetical protein
MSQTPLTEPSATAHALPIDCRLTADRPPIDDLLSDEDLPLAGHRDCSSTVQP